MKKSLWVTISALILLICSIVVCIIALILGKFDFAIDAGIAIISSIIWGISEEIASAGEPIKEGRLKRGTEMEILSQVKHSDHDNEYLYIVRISPIKMDKELFLKTTNIYEVGKTYKKTTGFLPQ